MSSLPGVALLNGIALQSFTPIHISSPPYARTSGVQFCQYDLQDSGTWIWLDTYNILIVIHVSSKVFHNFMRALLPGTQH